ncbi:hypothetical protein [Nonomuraea sp. NPDC046570]
MPLPAAPSPPQADDGKGTARCGGVSTPADLHEMIHIAMGSP